MIKMRTLFKFYMLLLFLGFSLGIMAQTKIYYVSPTGVGDGTSWETTTTLQTALQNAVAGDQIWVQGFEQITSADQLYIAPADGFSLKSGVQLYGGFKGDETNVNSRETLGKPYQMKYRSVLSGDIKRDDVVDNTNLIFPANTTRSDNATHVLNVNMAPASGNNKNTSPTIINGFSIGNGHADGSGEKGGGIYIHGDNTGGGIFRIERCFLLNNYATQGGAIYVDVEVKNVNNSTSLVNQCVVYNNAAGERAAVENAGGGLYLAGEATVVNSSIFNNENGGLRLADGAKVVNSTVSRNSSGGIDMINDKAEGYNVANTIIWGNSTLSTQYRPKFKNSAFHEVEAGDSDGNIYVTAENRGDTNAPMFDAPSLKTSYDRDFNWRQTAYPLWSWNVLEGSVMLSKGDQQSYDQSAYGSEDMAGNPRFNGSTIDIGAYEFQQMLSTRIRYVKPVATGTGDGSSWENASGNLQNMIDELAKNNPQNLPGEVWVAAGTYVPQVQVISGTTYSASFLMRDGISVYGGFAGDESSKQEREVGKMPWNFVNKTILEGSYYEHSKTSWNESNHKWTLTSDSRHVVFFSPLPSEGKSGFDKSTILNGVTIRGGYAQGGEGVADFMTDRGAGVYMGINATLEKCIVTENSSTGNGGAVYMYGGRVMNSLIYNNNADGDGGAVYVDNAGIVLASMLTNNSANNGSGAYLAHTGNWTDGKPHPEYLILSTSVVSNNTSRLNGAVYCAKGGVLMQNTITNNDCPTATDNTSANASQSGGLYVDSYGLVINSVLWNNTIQKRNIPMYAKNPTPSNVRFLYTALSGINNAVWNNVLQQEVISLAESNNIAEEGVLSPDFVAEGLPESTGVTGLLEDVNYFWQPVTGANLRARGMTLGTFPDDVLVAPEIDIAGTRFAQKPAVGAYSVEATNINPEDTGDALKVYVDVECAVATHDGSSWANGYRSLNEAIAYLSGLDKETVGNKRLEVHVMEGDIWPRYAFTNLDPQTATIDIPAAASGATLYIYGGYHRSDDKISVERNPLTYRSVINGNHEGKNIEDGLYHCITVAKGAAVCLDGFHIINGYAAGEASRQYGAGLLVHDGANVTVNNCIFENNTAQEGSAIDARNASLTMNNCVVNNNTNIDQTAMLVNCSHLTMNHVTIVNNIGAAPEFIGYSSFSVGNSKNDTQTLASLGAYGAKNFANPTNKSGATLGFDTYFGGYSNFSPLTSSSQSGNLINKASGTPDNLITDISGKLRNLGGGADLGAYEAKLPENGTVFYVTENGAGKMDGSSWENAIAGNLIYDVDNNKIVEGRVLTTDTRYIGFFDQTNRPYGETSGASKLFFEHLNESNLNSSNVNYKTETHDGIIHVTGANGINIRNRREERYVGGLQYAVERASALAEHDGKQKTVWVAGGIYTDYKGFVIRDKVNVLGGFPNEGTPGEDDRHPLVSRYIPTNDADVGLDKDRYETIIQIQSDNPKEINLPERTRKPVLFQPDVCLPTKSPSGRESSYSYWKWGRSLDNWFYHWINEGYGNFVPDADESASNVYRWKDMSGGYVEYSGAMWDGFTIRHGFYTDYKANRDGGAGVRMFRGVTIQNCVVTDNYINNHNSSGRGAGIYCDGDNSRVVNCFVLNNSNNSNESYGGGMYMILGTSYNTLVANNYAKSNGGGIFIEDAMFYNNTVAFNSSSGTGGLHQWTASSGTTTTLKIYNTIFYGNSGRAIGVENTNNFNGAWNCYVHTISDLDKVVFEKIKDSQKGTSLDNPFESANAQNENNYRLNSTTWCLNNGAESLGNDYQGKPIALPTTDVDFTDRIKDCTVDIGAYESANEENIAYEQHNDAFIYYVTQNGNGLRSGGSLANAACAMKLQNVLEHAGITAKENPDIEVIVKLAGYESASFVYNANTLSNQDDPQSYTYVIPYGVTVMGGFSDKDGNWDDDNDGYKRDPITYKTVLSAINNSSSLEQKVNGYHTVTFGEKPSDWNGNDKKSIIDGIYLIDGKATSMAGNGNPNTRGGGAVVPSWAHVRNCVVARCEAIEGGGLYVLPGGIVSGSLIMDNTAENGAGVYADNTNAGKDSRAHMVSCTVTDNTASSIGGGLFLEDGAMMVTNSILWGNTAPSDKNISGVLTEALEDDVWSSVEHGISAFYPVNHSFVETYEMPSNFENTTMESNEDLYFASSSRLLKAYSPLIKHGMDTVYQDAMASRLGISSVDMQGISRIQADMPRIDAGAFAFEGGTIPTDVLLTRIFVSQGANVQLPEGEDMDKYIGRSFYTSLTWLDDALEYIKAVRENGVAKETDRFEILLAGGTYKPSYRRMDASTETVDQRQNSYVIPQGVSIYGGFNGTEQISSKSADGQDIVSIPGVTGSFTCMGDISEILSNRAYSDFNQNGINEPWELASQVILSGNVNVSEQVKNVYHVVYSDAKENQEPLNPVILDGLTIMDGETSNILSNAADTDEIGRGGGIYSNGVSYLLNRCRLINNFAVRGGAVYMRDAKLTIVNSILAGNGTVDNAQPVVPTQLPRGGAVYVAGVSDAPKVYAGLYAVNTLWVNNETVGQGGAIGTNYADGIIGPNYVPEVSLMNNTFVRNKAQSNAVIYHHNGKNTITNTLMWGNEITGENIPQTDETNTSIAHSASDAVDLSKYSDTNILLSTDNTSVTGPRFTKPSSTAGVAGNDANNQWNPAAISVLTDAGDGTHKVATGSGTIDGAYADWMRSNTGEYATQYMGYKDYMDTYLRYAGPLKEDGTSADKPIDIGLYEYQYEITFPQMDAIYVATVESGKADGSNWANATSDLRGALTAMANPTGGTVKDKAVYIKAGEYSLPRMSTGTAFTVSMGDTQYGESLNVKGSYNESGVQDFSKPTVITTQESNADVTSLLMDVAANNKPVTIEGLTFINKNSNGGTGMQASTGGGKVTLKNVGFRGNRANGLNIVSGSSGKILLVNTLFADGGTGLNGADSRTTVVNATFANNKTDLTTSASVPSVYNSVSWNNDTQNLTTDDDNKNVAITRGVANDNVNEGPNFRDPDNADVYNRDYRIRPSVKLLNKGSNANYAEQALAAETIPAEEKDLGNNQRVVDGSVDVGAYEYEAPLQPIVYVKADLTATADGKSWETALGDLQGAVDLAGLYALGHSGQNGYVFVHGNYHDTGLLNMSLGNTKVYGSMNDERSAETETDRIVSDLLGKRKGMLVAASRSSLENVTIGADGVIDGFEITGKPVVNAGVLSTSIVNNGVEGAAGGLLYNSLVLGSVNAVKAVNVTSAEAINGAAGSGNNRASVAETNSYVTDDYWEYQLMETSQDIDPTGNRTDINEYIMKVGHERDLIGNRRIRNAVDNGCFETWNISSDYAITADDYPVGRSVVYVRKGQELSVKAGVYPNGNAFNPGYLLLEHQAGLRGNGNYISLTNFAVERDVTVNGNDLAVMPFEVKRMSPLSGYNLKRYSGQVRAAYSYQYDGSDGKAWTDGGFAQIGTTEGFLIENTSNDNITVRFSGKQYSEGGADKSVVLYKWNYNEPWNSSSSAGNKFTHKENMSWNLFGSPYLCAMNYGDMEYGRVIYGYTEGAYKTINTAGETAGGYIPAGDAVFTQTATLKDAEIIGIKTSEQKDGVPYAAAANLTVGLSQAGATRAAGADKADVLQLNAVPENESRNYFDIASDGVKWMAADSVAQLYAARSGARYSLLSAVSQGGEVAVGVTLPEPGMYTFYIPETCDAGNYESVVLKDAKTGKQTNLLDGGYDFTSVEGDNISGRFTISFNRMLDDDKNADIRAWSPLRDRVSVSGVEAGDRIAVYSADGVQAASCVASSSVENIQASVSGVAVVEITRDGRTIAVRKVKMK